MTKPKPDNYIIPILVKYITLYVLGILFSAGFMDIVSHFDPNQNMDWIISVFSISWGIFCLCSGRIEYLNSQDRKDSI
jgi:hypothetical protein